MKILFISLGCDKNLVDTEVMLGLLASRGYEMTDDEAEADIIVINTCCFIHDAKEESIQNILEMAEYKKEGRVKALIVTGCLAERYRQEILDEIPEENMRWESKPEPRFGGMEHDSTFGGDRYEEGWGSASARTGGSWSSGGVHSYRAPAQAAQRPLQSLRKNAAPAATLLKLQEGDMGEHTAFGKGMVLSVRPMGGDALVEVAFDNVGKKKLMLKSAGAHMRKL